jgi:hypothetical protein
MAGSYAELNHPMRTSRSDLRPHSPLFPVATGGPIKVGQRNNRIRNTCPFGQPAFYSAQVISRGWPIVASSATRP